MNLLANFAKAVDPAVKVVFNGDFKQVENNAEKICKVGNATDYTTEMASNVGLTMAEHRAEAGSVNYEDFLAGDSKNLTQYVYDKGVKISKKLMKWQKLNQIKSLVSNAAQSITRRREFDITKLLERGFATSYTHSVDGSTLVDLTGGNAKALFASNHATTRSSTAQDNRINDGTTYNMDMAEDAFEAAEGVTAPSITDNSDQVIDMRPDYLFHSRKKSWTVGRLLKTVGRVGTPNNDINLLKGRYKSVELPYLDTSYNEYYFLQDSIMNAREGFMTLLYGSPKGYEMDGPYIDFDSKAIKYSWEMEFAAGHNNYQSYIGSKGTNLNA